MDAATKCIGEAGQNQLKAAEDSRTPRRCRDGLHDIHSARFWSAAVLCRFTKTCDVADNYAV